MSEDLTKKPADLDSDKLTLILTIVRKLETHGSLLLQVVERVNVIETRLDAIERRLDVIEGRLDVIEGRLDVIERRLDAIETRLDAVENRLDSLEQTGKRSVSNPAKSQT